MSDYNTDGTFDNSWDDRGDVVWNEFDWEQYLRGQDEIVLRYLAFYEKLKNAPQRLDEAAKLMGWSSDEWNGDGESDAPATSGDAAGKGPASPEPDASAAAPAGPASDAAGKQDDGADEQGGEEGLIPDMSEGMEPYTMQQNPVFIATRAIYLSLSRSWERLATDPAIVPQVLAVRYLASLQRGETQSLLAIQALDFGDYALAISLLKRAMLENNAAMGLLGSVRADASRTLHSYCRGAMPRLFDLREIWLRVMSECRHELAYPSDDDYEEDDEDDDF